MADDLEQLTIDVHTKLATIRAGIAAPDVADVPRSFGALNWEVHDKAPLVMWKLGEIEATEPQRVGGTNTEVASLEQEYLIRIWHTDRQSVLTLLRDLLKAIRATALGPNIVDKGRWRWVTEAEEAAWMNSGAALESVRPMSIAVPARDIASTTVQITSQAHTVSMLDPATGNPTVVC